MNMGLKTYLASIFSLCILFASCTQTSKTASNTSNITSSGVDSPGNESNEESLGKVTDVEQGFLQKINNLRKQQGAGPLQISNELQLSAAKHSEVMNDAEKLSHAEGMPGTFRWSSDKRIRLELARTNATGFTITGENIACGSATAEGVYQQWLTSPEHYENMIEPQFQFIGIARAGTDEESNQKICPYYWTTDFGGVVQQADSQSISHRIHKEN